MDCGARKNLSGEEYINRSRSALWGRGARQLSLQPGRFFGRDRPNPATKLGAERGGDRRKRRTCTFATHPATSAIRFAAAFTGPSVK